MKCTLLVHIALMSTLAAHSVLSMESREAEDTSSATQEAAICAICLEECKPEEQCVQLERCEHLFHLVCWRRHLESSPRMNCPLCRSTDLEWQITGTVQPSSETSSDPEQEAVETARLRAEREQQRRDAEAARLRAEQEVQHQHDAENARLRAEREQLVNDADVVARIRAAREAVRAAWEPLWDAEAARHHGWSHGWNSQ